jgi:hypothetical protein
MLATVDAARIDADVRKLASFGTRHSLSDTTSETRGIGAASRWVRGRFETIAPVAGGRLEARLEAFDVPAGPRVPTAVTMHNVVAELRGSGAPGRYVIVSGHLDSRVTDVMDAEKDAPGANDDASGVAAVLEACRVMAPYTFEATVLFVAVSGEEQGLFGSKALASRLAAEKAEVLAMLTNDIVGASVSSSGASDKAHVRVFSAGLPPPGPLFDALLAVGGEADSPSRQLARSVEESAAIYLDDFSATVVGRLDRYLRGGDHRPFYEAGYPAARLTEVHENFERQHRDVEGERFGDVVEAVDPAYVANVVRVNVAALATLARAPSPPAEARLDVRGLAEDTTVLWAPLPGARYELLARPTTAPSWTEHLDAGTTGTFTVALSKDNWHFGLRALDAEGHASLAVFPLPLKEGQAWPP